MMIPEGDKKKKRGGTFKRYFIYMSVPMYVLCCVSAVCAGAEGGMKRETDFCVRRLGVT